ncbi:MAG: ATP-binding cassette domain-containing protein [Nitrososphaerota archaeon]|nr:ATP-binding cassette domain-containing protein [Nitrososphaerota archaeon]MDG6939822.1 ATP-binding cassette domain-containing protein [Nitrososphaerota archaeon]
MTEVAALVQVRALSKSFDGKSFAVDGVTFEIGAGEVFGLLGPNGAGKTTTIKMMTTLLRPSSGTASVCGRDIRKDAREVRRVVGVVPQEYTTDEDMSGLENITLIADLYGIPRRISSPRARELLRLVDLDEAGNRKVSTYSGGMRRRLELACGLINRPSLLFLDEPTLGLDVQTRAAVWSYIRKLKKEYGMTLLMTTHYLEEADSLCDRIAIIDHGKIVAMGSPRELKASVGGDIIQVGLKEADGDASDILRKVGQVREVKRTSPSDYRVKAEVGEEAAPQVMDALRTNGYHVNTISLTKPSLDEVYLEYTGRSLRDEDTGKVDAMAQRRMMRMARS